MKNRDKGDTFSIDSTTGRIFLNKKIDREVQDSHVIRVTASDGGGRTAVCEMKVQVQDVNDSEPQFNNFKNQIQVSTDVKQGEILYEFDVTDLGKCSIQDPSSHCLRSYGHAIVFFFITSQDHRMYR